MKPRLRQLGCAALLAAAGGALACGVCDEDKMAATYDHAVVQRASASGKLVVFCGLDRAVDAGRVRLAARRVPGIDAASVRVSANPAALSFVLDASGPSPQAAAQAMQRALPPGTRVTVLRLAGATGAGAPGTAVRKN